MNSPTERQEIPLIIATRRDIFQWVSKIKGFEEQYQERSAVVWLSLGDMKALKMEEGDNIRLRNALDAIVVQAKVDSGCPQGLAFMPVSRYSSRLVGYDPSKAKLPGFKRIEVLAELTEEEVTFFQNCSEPGRDAVAKKEGTFPATSNISTTASH